MAEKVTNGKLVDLLVGDLLDVVPDLVDALVLLLASNVPAGFVVKFITDGVHVALGESDEPVADLGFPRRVATVWLDVDLELSRGVHDPSTNCRSVTRCCLGPAQSR